MKKSSLIFSAVLIVIGSVVGLGLWWYNRPQTELPSLTADSPMDGSRNSADRQAPEFKPPTPISPTQKIRLAIGSLGEADDQRNRQIADVLTAQLSKTKGLELVERQALDKVLSEIHLTVSGLVRANDAVRAGRLLRADWFLVASRSKSAATNALVTRLVDARTGVVRDVGVFEAQPDIAPAASQIADFVSHARENASNPKPKTFLAIGQFADVSLNNRQASFASELRTYLMSAYRDSNVLLLEREQVDALLQEVYLDLSGLSEVNTNSPVQMQSAFWFVDGYFQSFETTEHEVEVALQIHRVFGFHTERKLRGKPNATLFSQIKGVVDSTIASSKPFLRAPSRVTEAREQLNKGRELYFFATGRREIKSYTTLGLSLGYQAPELALRNLEEAIRAFETVLLLEPSRLEAKFDIAACYQEPLIGRTNEARALLQEVAGAGDEKWSPEACMGLGWSYLFVDARESAKWFNQAADHMKDPVQAKFARQKAEESLARAIVAQSAKTGTLENSEARDVLLKQLIGNIQSADNVMHEKGGTMTSDYGFYQFARALGKDKEVIASAVASVLPTLNTNFPHLRSHLLAAAVTFQVDTNSAVYQEFRQSLIGNAAQPEKLFAAEWYFKNLLSGTYDWAIANTNYVLASELVEAKHRAATRLPRLELTPTEKVRLAFAYVGQKNWKEALAAFEDLGETPVVMPYDGLWGRASIPVLPAAAAARCRNRLGLPPLPQNPQRFDLGSPLLAWRGSAAFTADDGGIWLSFPDRLVRITVDLETNATAQIPDGLFVDPKVMCQDADHVWIGTDGSGLIEYDKSSKKFLQYTVKDGLLLENIATLHLSAGALWIGFGKGLVGGLGRLDVEPRKFTMFTPHLNSSSAPSSVFVNNVPDERADEAPNHFVRTIATGAGGDIFLDVGGLLRRYRLGENRWSTIQGVGPIVGLCADNHYLIAGLGVPLSRVEFIDPKTQEPLQIPPKEVTLSEFQRLESDPTNRGKLRRSMSDGFLGALSIREPPASESRVFADDGSLPGRPYALVINGSDVWIGGDAYIAVFDLKEKKVRKLSYIPSRTVDNLQIEGDYLWAQFQRRLYRLRLSTVK